MTQQSHDGSALFYRMEAVERAVQEKVPIKEYDLQTRMQKEASDRIEQNLSQLILQVSSLHEKVNSAELEAQRRDAAQRENQNKLQIWILIGIVSFFVAILLSIIGAFATHIIH